MKDEEQEEEEERKEKIRMVSGVSVEKKILAWNLVQDSWVDENFPVYSYWILSVSAWAIICLEHSRVPEFKLVLSLLQPSGVGCDIFFLPLSTLEMTSSFAFSPFKYIPHRTYPKCLDWMFLNYSGSQSVLPRPAASVMPRNLLEMWILGPTLDLFNEKLWGWGPVFRVLSPPGDFDAWLSSENCGCNETKQGGQKVLSPLSPWEVSDFQAKRMR